MRSFSQLVIGFAAMFTLTSPAFAESAFIFGNFFGNPDTGLITYADPGFDTRVVECGSPTQIRAQLFPVDGGVVTISTTCVAPESETGKTGVEMAWPGRASNSAWAKVNNCQAAVVTVTAIGKTHAQAEHQYGGYVECLNKPLVAGYDTVVTDR